MKTIVDFEHFTVENKDRAFNFVTCNSAARHDADGNPILVIQTPIGIITAVLGDFIVKDVDGDFYPCTLQRRM